MCCNKCYCFICVLAWTKMPTLVPEKEVTFSRFRYQNKTSNIKTQLFLHSYQLLLASVFMNHTFKGNAWHNCCCCTDPRYWLYACYSTSTKDLTIWRWCQYKQGLSFPVNLSQLQNEMPTFRKKDKNNACE